MPRTTGERSLVSLPQICPRSAKSEAACRFKNIDARLVPSSLDNSWRTPPTLRSQLCYSRLLAGTGGRNEARRQLEALAFLCGGAQVSFRGVKHNVKSTARGAPRDGRSHRELPPHGKRGGGQACERLATAMQRGFEIMTAL